MHPFVERSGDAIIAVWESYKLGISFEQFREGAYGLTAEVTVASTVSAETRHGPVRLGLLSQRDIRELTTDCGKRFGDIAEWSLVIPSSVTAVLDEYRSGNAPVRLCDVPNPGEPQYLIPDFLLANRNVFLSAYGGSAKSIIGMAIAISVATGEPWAEMRPSDMGPVLYLDWEDEADTQSRRMAEICAGYGLSTLPDNLYHWSMGTPLKEAQRAISRFVRDNGIKLVVVDSIGAAIGGELTKDDAAIQGMVACRNLSPASRLIIAHISKADAEKNPGERKTFGSAFFEFGARDVWQAHRIGEPGANQISISFANTKANHGQKQPFGLRVVFEPGTIRFERHDSMMSIELADGLSQPDLVCSILRAEGELDVKHLEQYTGLTARQLNRILYRLKCQSRINQMTDTSGKNTVYSLNYQHRLNQTEDEE
jgi:hypothetical protein